MRRVLFIIACAVCASCASAPPPSTSKWYGYVLEVEFGTREATGKICDQPERKSPACFRRLVGGVKDDLPVAGTVYATEPRDFADWQALFELGKASYRGIPVIGPEETILTPVMLRKIKLPDTDTAAPRLAKKYAIKVYLADPEVTRGACVNEEEKAAFARYNLNPFNAIPAMYVPSRACYYGAGSGDVARAVYAPLPENAKDIFPFIALGHEIAHGLMVHDKKSEGK